MTFTPHRYAARAGVLAVQGVASHYAMGHLAGWDMLRIIASVAIQVEERSLHGCASRREGEDRSTLVLEAGLPHNAKRFLKLRAAGEVYANDPYGLTGAADLFALVGVLNVGESLERGEAWVSKVIADLGAINVAWSRRSLPLLLRDARRLLLGLSRNPNYALLAGRLERHACHYGATAKLYARGLEIAVRMEDWDAAARIHIARGNMDAARGNMPSARARYADALCLADMHCLGEPAARASHDLLVLATETGEAGGEVWALRATHDYGAGHPRLPYLAHDLACYWASRGEFAGALRVLQRCAHLFTNSAEAILPVSNIARCTGALGMRAEFAAAARRVKEWGLLRSARPLLAQSLINVAHGAASLGDWDRSERFAARAQAIATRRREHKRAYAAGVLLDMARSRSLPAPDEARPGPQEILSVTRALSDALAAG